MYNYPLQKLHSVRAGALRNTTTCASKLYRQRPQPRLRTACKAEGTSVGGNLRNGIS